jgi:hypothetical protein
MPLKLILPLDMTGGRLDGSTVDGFPGGGLFALGVHGLRLGGSGGMLTGISR